ncbi:hypothetical protein CH260_24415 [Rhodococcus sp. 05-2256-B2]|nr:hypothetical protein CH258_10645 [Rhodococcus sp. 05-2256-B4]OZD89881.1 hypothetical protein CH260_24415 [Rhodococcus sp. 05-2256-B2]OZD92199.1 hypothetical protein CH257_13965 [Rhodococcus sp. 05-2256-B3]OZD98904.1 hypothetical protein CH285_22420 [Rhodococcus sp. 05-2256-B1]
MIEDTSRGQTCPKSIDTSNANVCASLSWTYAETELLDAKWDARREGEVTVGIQTASMWVQL